MKNTLTILLLLLGMTAQGVTVPKGEERLRELIVVPTLKMTFGLSFSSFTIIENLTEEGTREDWIEQTRKKLKSEPNDLRMLLQLGRLLDANDDTNAAKVAYEKAAAMGRQRLEQRPNDGVNLTLLARAVWGLDNKTEAESLYRHATLVASNDWHCWLGLGEFLRQQADSSLGTNINHAQFRYQKSLNGPRFWYDGQKLASSPDKLDQAITLCHEASTCFQRAYEIVPQEFEVLVHLGQYRSYSNWLAVLDRQYRTDAHSSVEDQTVDVFSLSFSPVAWPDYEKALAIRPQSYRLVVMLLCAEWASAVKEVQRSENTHPPSIKELPEKSQQRIINYFQRLKVLSDGPDKKVASGALTSACMLKLQFGESQDLVSELQRAVKYDPANEQAWNMLIGLAASEATPDKLTELCERRLKAKKSALNHLILAKALYKQKRFKEATKHAEAAIKLEPKNVPAHLMRGAILLRLSKGEEGEDERDSAFDAAAELIKQSAYTQESQEWWLVYALNAVIGAAINGDDKSAKEWLEMCKKVSPEDARVKEIQSALP